MRRSKPSSYEYIYVMQEREFINSKEPTYKVGRTTNPSKRFAAYPKNSELLLLCGVLDCKTAEMAVKNMMKAMFVQKTEYGCEYFQGDATEIKASITQLLYPSIGKRLKCFWKRKPLPVPPQKPLPMIPTANSRWRNKGPSQKSLPLLEQGPSLTIRKIPVNTACPKCPRILSSKQKLMQHLKKPMSCDFTCRICSFKAKNRHQFYRHHKDKHSRNKINLISMDDDHFVPSNLPQSTPPNEVCPKEMAQDLETKRKPLPATPTTNTLPQLTCPKCNTGLSTKQKLNQHLKKSLPCDLVCKDCGLKLSNRFKFYRHHKDKHPSIKKASE